MFYVICLMLEKGNCNVTVTKILYNLQIYEGRESLKKREASETVKIVKIKIY